MKILSFLLTLTLGAYILQQKSYDKNLQDDYTPIVELVHESQLRIGQIISYTSTLNSNQNEYEYRRSIKKMNLKIITHENKKNQKFKLCNNKYVDMTTQQWRQLFLHLNVPQQIKFFHYQKLIRKKNIANSASNNSSQINKTIIQDNATNVDNSTIAKNNTTNMINNTITENNVINVTNVQTVNIDWRNLGIISEIRSQGSCGSCYAFSTIAAIQTAFLMIDQAKYKNLDLSQQQLLDCNYDYGNNGCRGGWIGKTFNYSLLNGNFAQLQYPYVGASQNCLKNDGNFKISSYEGGVIQNCDTMSKMLKNSPLSVAVSAGTIYWKQYSSGILDQCGQTIDHAVQLVGEVKNSTHNYWIIKNSMGVEWGQQGFVRLDKGLTGDTCQICYAAYYSLVNI